MYALTIRRAARVYVCACMRGFSQSLSVSFFFFFSLFRRVLKSYSSESFHIWTNILRGCVNLPKPASTFVNLCDVCTARRDARDTVFVLYGARVCGEQVNYSFFFFS